MHFIVFYVAIYGLVNCVLTVHSTDVLIRVCMCSVMCLKKERANRSDCCPIEILLKFDGFDAMIREIGRCYQFELFFLLL